MSDNAISDKTNSGPKLNNPRVKAGELLDHAIENHPVAGRISDGLNQSINEIKSSFSDGGKEHHGTVSADDLPSKPDK